MLSGKCSMRRVTSAGTTTVNFGAFAFVKTFGTVDDGSDTDDGYLVSVAIPKALVGLTGKASFKLRPALVDYADAKKKDATLTGGSMSTTNAAHWPQVMLDS